MEYQLDDGGPATAGPGCTPQSVSWFAAMAEDSFTAVFPDLLFQGARLRAAPKSMLDYMRTPVVS